ncbi:Histone chaperone asf1b-B-like [Oopsacas minuta]|uniref:Histone chaperone asf1b-B-like n=1 Tax=Oopsacas minuta TaxID=111878 RepID=A0AAV7KD07_9METZ|nr:Histone chaperone asf1b-B-like [Oopsacas minuta]
MSKIEVINVQVKDNPCHFVSPFKFEITFECFEDLPQDLEWKIIYVGSAASSKYDQTLDSVLVGPVPAGRHMFLFEAKSPDVTKLPLQDTIGVTVVLLTCSYREREFVRIGYYVNNEYDDEEMQSNPPPHPLFDRIRRNVLAECPRVTRFAINWEDNTAIENLDAFGIPKQEIGNMNEFSSHGAIDFSDLNLYPQSGQNPVIAGAAKLTSNIGHTILQSGDQNHVQQECFAKTKEEPMNEQHIS